MSHKTVGMKQHLETPKTSNLASKHLFPLCIKYLSKQEASQLQTQSAQH